MDDNLIIRGTQDASLSNVIWSNYYDDMYYIEALTIRNKSARNIIRIKYSYEIKTINGKELIDSGKWMLPSDGTDGLIRPGDSQRMNFSNTNVHINSSQILYLTIDAVITK